MNKAKEQVKSLLPFFISIEKHSGGKIVNFDYALAYNTGEWEASITLWNGATLEFLANSMAELYDMVDETIEKLNLN